MGWHATPCVIWGRGSHQAAGLVGGGPQAQDATPCALIPLKARSFHCTILHANDRTRFSRSNALGEASCRAATRPILAGPPRVTAYR